MKQTNTISGNTYISNFSPVLGGNYDNGSLTNENAFGFWWTSEASNGAARYRLAYNSSSLYTDNFGRRGGRYIRCVSEEKDVSDLTYMQTKTPSVAAFSPPSFKNSVS